MPPGLAFDHLNQLTSPTGLYEHALGTTPRRKHGYCVDDVARALVVTTRDPQPTDAVRALAAGYLDFVLSALRPDGYLHNRRRLDGTWSDRPSSDDHWGRALWAMGTAAASSDDPEVAALARAGAGIALRSRSAWPRSMAYGALGAGQILRVVPGDVSSLRFLEDARRVLNRPRPGRSWPWPEERLTYANAVLPEAMIVIGQALDDDSVLGDGLLLLDWLVTEQQHNGHLSVVPSSGWSRADHVPAGREAGHPTRPGYAQQPIEVAVLAEACHTAHGATGDERWTAAIEQCHSWFLGANDGGVAMCNPQTGGGFDGLERDGASLNQGAESTLAWLSTQQIALSSTPAAVR
jgi:hypothetical protein